MNKYFQSGLSWVGALMVAGTYPLQVMRHTALAYARQGQSTSQTTNQATNQLERWAQFEAEAKVRGAITLAFKMTPESIARYETGSVQHKCLYKEVYPNSPAITKLDQEIWAACVTILELEELTN